MASGVQRTPSDGVPLVKDGSSDDAKLNTTPHAHRDAAHTMHAEHSAHHLRYGAIKTSGFAPPPRDGHEGGSAAGGAHGYGFDEDDLRVCGARGIRHEEIWQEQLDAEARRIHGKRRYLVRKPRALQYFRGNTLVRADEERSSQRISLFFDLIFVSRFVLSWPRTGAYRACYNFRRSASSQCSHTVSRRRPQSSHSALRL